MGDDRAFRALGLVSIQLVSPASGESSTVPTIRAPGYDVSIQLVSPASGEPGKYVVKVSDTTNLVSIQLVSPASGEVTGPPARIDHPVPGFHSIGFPSEWGVSPMDTLVKALYSFHSIGFPSEWGEKGRRVTGGARHKFPFNWFPQRVGS